MNFQTMSKQRKFVLISAAAGFISMFLPWVSLSIFGYSQSVNGMHDKGILVFLCFVTVGIIALLGDQIKNLDTTPWIATLIAGAIALLLVVWFYSQAANSILGSSGVGFGLYIAGLSSIGILLSAYFYRSATDNLKDGFKSVKKDFETKFSNSGKLPPESSNPPTTPPVMPGTTVVEDDLTTP